MSARPARPAPPPPDGAPDVALSCVRPLAADETVLSVSVVPNAKRTEVVGLHDGDLRVRLAAPPVDGKANDTLTAWVAAQLQLPKRAVRLLRGPASRQKQLVVDAPAGDVQRWVAEQLAAVTGG